MIVEQDGQELLIGMTDRHLCSRVDFTTENVTGSSVFEILESHLRLKNYLHAFFDQ